MEIEITKKGFQRANLLPLKNGYMLIVYKEQILGSAPDFGMSYQIIGLSYSKTQKRFIIWEKSREQIKSSFLRNGSISALLKSLNKRILHYIDIDEFVYE